MISEGYILVWRGQKRRRRVTEEGRIQSSRKDEYSAVMAIKESSVSFRRPVRSNDVTFLHKFTIFAIAVDSIRIIR